MFSPHDSWIELRPANPLKPSLWDAVRPLLWQERVPIAGPIPSSIDAGQIYWLVDINRVTPEQQAVLRRQLKMLYPHLQPFQIYQLMKQVEISRDIVGGLEVGGDDLYRSLQHLVITPETPLQSEVSPDLSLSTPTRSANDDQTHLVRFPMNWLWQQGRSLRSLVLRHLYPKR
jgi:hypothetical protein